MDVCVVCCRGISDMRTGDIKVDNGEKGQNTRKKRNPVGSKIFRSGSDQP
jgi:hypothetical protein